MLWASLPALQENQFEEITGWPDRSASRKSTTGIWLVSFMDYDLGYVELEERTLQPLETLRAKSFAYFLGQSVTHVFGLDKQKVWRRGWDSNPR
jgi:hypothetical protein